MVEVDQAEEHIPHVDAEEEMIGPAHLTEEGSILLVQAPRKSICTTN